MVMSFTIRYCDIELEHHLQILVNKYEKFAQDMLGVLAVLQMFCVRGGFVSLCVIL